METSLSVVHPHAAGIDIGAEKIFVAVDGQPVKSFETFTMSLIEALHYLQAHSVTTVAMEATGVYWLPLYDILERGGIKVFLVNSAQLKYVPGRKSDVQDCEWLRQLHCHGLLRSSFVPEDQIRTLRSYVRLRDDHIRMAASHIQHMQKALDLMNLKLHNVISQVHGASGLRIIRAILAGERNPEVLANLCDRQILKSKRAQVIKSLEGTYKPEHLFALRQALELWETYQQKIVDCDREIDAFLTQMTDGKPAQPSPRKPKAIRHHKPQIDELHDKLLQLTDGKDATILPGITDASLMKAVGELGTDMSPWPTGKHFTSWLRLAPGKHSSGKRSKNKRQRAKTQAGQIFRQAAASIAKSKHLALGSFYRRIRAKRGAMVANVATARKLAILYYNLMKHGLDFVELGVERYEILYRQRTLKYLTKKARELGFVLQVVTPGEVH